MAWTFLERLQDPSYIQPWSATDSHVDQALHALQRRLGVGSRSMKGFEWKLSYLLHPAPAPADLLPPPDSDDCVHMQSNSCPAASPAQSSR